MKLANHILMVTLLMIAGYLGSVKSFTCFPRGTLSPRIKRAYVGVGPTFITVILKDDNNEYDNNMEDKEITLAKIQASAAIEGEKYKAVASAVPLAILIAIVVYFGNNMNSQYTQLISKIDATNENVKSINSNIL